MTKDNGTVEKRYKIVFIPDDEYSRITTKFKKTEKEYNPALIKSGIENFSIVGTESVFIPDKYRAFLNEKAKKGESF